MNLPIVVGYSRRLALTFACVVALTVPFAGKALAHDSLVKANIPAGHIYAHNTYPRVLAGNFAENVKPSQSWIHVFDGDITSDHGLADIGANGYPLRNPKQMTTSLPRGLRGKYSVIWFTTSADDNHQAGNAFTFTAR